MRSNVRSRNWKQATSFMDVRDGLPNGPSGPLFQLLGCSPNINEPFLTRDNGSLRTHINFISVGVLSRANLIWGAIYLLVVIEAEGFGRDLFRTIRLIVTLFRHAALKREERLFRADTLFSPILIFVLCFQLHLCLSTPALPSLL